MVTFKPRACNNFANEAAIIPLPNEDVTPPVTKIYFDIRLIVNDENFNCLNKYLVV